MGNAARKARKRAYRKFAPLGEIADPGQFQHRRTVKTATPPEERIGVLLDPHGGQRSVPQMEKRLRRLGTSLAEVAKRRGLGGVGYVAGRRNKGSADG